MHTVTYRFMESAAFGHQHIWANANCNIHELRVSALYYKFIWATIHVLKEKSWKRVQYLNLMTFQFSDRKHLLWWNGTNFGDAEWPDSSIMCACIVNQEALLVSHYPVPIPSVMTASRAVVAILWPCAQPVTFMSLA